MPATFELVLSCEHAGNRVPAEFAPLFRGREARSALDSHLGWDSGAVAVARRLARRFGARLHVQRVTRLLVDSNRSVGHPRLWSRWSRRLAPPARARVVARYHSAYRDAVQADIERRLVVGAVPVLHLSIHSFTPTLGGVRRNADVGLLYDPRRTLELATARALQRELRQQAPTLRVRRNYPYRGVDDGFVPFLRARLPRRRYVGLEIELNQAQVALAGPLRRQLSIGLEGAVGHVLQGAPGRRTRAG